MVLAQNPDRVDLRVLSQFPEFAEFRSAGSGDGRRIDGGDGPTVESESAQATPEERMAEASRELRSALAADLLERIHEQPPEFFEQLVLDVLRAMGYGGSGDGAVERLGRSGDEGVDGVIREDPLGLDLIYVQAKRWQGAVGRPEVQRFFGALHGQRATKGVMITTSSFSREAVAYAEGVTPRVILVDGRELAQLMIEHGVGVAVARTYKVMRLDLDYFLQGDDGVDGDAGVRT